MPTFGLGSSFMPALTATGGHITPRLAENLATVQACVNAITSGIASLPALVYQQSNAGRTEAPNHPVARLVRQPNPYQTWPDFIETMLGSTLLHGNGLAIMQHDGAGRPTALIPVPWHCVQPMLLPSGMLAFDVVAYTSPWAFTGLPRRYLSTEVVHLKDRSDDGLLGRSRLSRSPDALGNALSLQAWSAHTWENGATPSGALKIPTALNKDSFDRLKEQVRSRHQGTQNARGVLILESGAEWQALSVSPEDAEVLDSRRFSVEEIARLFQVPPPLLQDYTRNTFSNATTAGLWFAQFSLAPWVVKIEAEFRRSVFGPSSPFELCIDLSGLTRGDFTARWAAYAIAVQNGILDPDEIRQVEGWNPRGAATGGATA